MLPHLIRKIKPEVKHNVGLKFLDRLKGWKLQCKQRNDGKLDVVFLINVLFEFNFNNLFIKNCKARPFC